MNETDTIDRLQRLQEAAKSTDETTLLRALLREWETYDGEIKNALGSWRYAAPTVPEVIALLVAKAEADHG